MPYNGSGTFTLAQAAFVPSTVISSSAMNSDLSDIAANGLTNAITKDGQTTITGALKGASGSVGLPAYSFSADLDCGMYRIGANNIGLAVNATKILDIATTGLTITGTLTVSGAQTFTGQASFPAGFLTGNGTVLLPAWSFTSDPDCGVYRIGANNIGVAVNAAKVLDIGTTGLNVVGSVSSNGTALVPQPQAAGMVNGTIVESHSGNATTFALKTLAGTDPSATDIVYFVFRNVTAATGDYVVLQVTTALSLTVSSGSTLGTVSSNIPFKLWLVAFNDASTVRLGVINCVLGGAKPTSVYPLGQLPIATSTAEGGGGGADSAQVFYTGTAVTSKAYLILAYASYETGVTTAGTWAASPTRLQLFGGGVPLPNTIVQTSGAQYGTNGAGTNNYTLSNTPPTTSNTNLITTQAITPSSATSLLRVRAQAVLAFPGGGGAAYATLSIMQDSGANALATSAVAFVASATPMTLPVVYQALSGLTVSTTFKIYTACNAGNVLWNQLAASTAMLGGLSNTYIIIDEIQT